MSVGLKINLLRKEYVKITIEQVSMKMTYMGRFVDGSRKVKVRFEGVDGLFIDGIKVGGNTWCPIVPLGSSVNVKYKDKTLAVEMTKFSGGYLIARFQGPHDFYIIRMTKEERYETKKRKVFPEEI